MRLKPATERKRPGLINRKVFSESVKIERVWLTSFDASIVQPGSCPVSLSLVLQNSLKGVKMVAKITWFSFWLSNLRSSTITELWFYHKSCKRWERHIWHWLVFKIYVNKFSLNKTKKNPEPNIYKIGVQMHIVELLTKKCAKDGLDRFNICEIVLTYSELVKNTMLLIIRFCFCDLKIYYLQFWMCFGINFWILSLVEIISGCTNIKPPRFSEVASK